MVNDSGMACSFGGGGSLHGKLLMPASGTEKDFGTGSLISVCGYASSCVGRRLVTTMVGWLLGLFWQPWLPLRLGQ